VSAVPELAAGTAALLPRDLGELAEALGRATPRSRLLAGGTDLVRSMTWDGLRPDLIIDLSGVRELAGVGEEDGRLLVGATTSVAQLQSDPLVRRHAACLALAAGSMGSTQTRNMATIGGNVANASPCGDTVPALLALEAVARVLGADGTISERPVREVITGYEKTSLAHDEALAGFLIPLSGGRCRSTYAKIGSRTTVTIARLSMALVVEHDPASAVLSRPRVGLGALGETAFREPRLEAFLDGRVADEETARLFAQECAAAVERAIPGRYSLAYKRAAAAGLADDAWRGLGFASAWAGGPR
jgi:xanthine dehydrogenase FAD-binding subunit